MDPLWVWKTWNYNIRHGIGRYDDIISKVEIGDEYKQIRYQIRPFGAIRISASIDCIVVKWIKVVVSSHPAWMSMGICMACSVKDLAQCPPGWLHYYKPVFSDHIISASYPASGLIQKWNYQNVPGDGHIGWMMSILYRLIPSGQDCHEYNPVPLQVIGFDGQPWTAAGFSTLQIHGVIKFYWSIDFHIGKFVPRINRWLPNAAIAPVGPSPLGAVIHFPSI